MTGHPDADALAACREGLLGRYRSARIRAHLARCSRCASLDSELAAVTALLASAPVPRMPDDLAGRLDGVLAAESAARSRGETPAAAGQAPAAAGQALVGAGQAPAAAGEPAGTAGEAGPRRGPRPDKPRPARAPRPWRAAALRAASVTAVLLVIAGGGYGVSRLLQPGSGASSSASSGSSAPREHIGSHAPTAQGPISGVPGAQPAIKTPAGGLLVVRSGTDYQPHQLVTQAQRVLARYRAGSAAHAPAAASGSASSMAGCVKLVPGGARAALMDEARYEGQPATVIVQAPAGGQPGRVWVIAPGCSAANRQVVAQASLPVSG